MSKKYYYPTRNSENHSRVSLVEVSEEFYRAVQPEIDRVRKRNQRNGSCVCPKKCCGLAISTALSANTMRREK